VEMSCKIWRTTRASLWALAARNAYFPIFLDLNHQVNKPFFLIFIYILCGFLVIILVAIVIR